MRSRLLLIVMSFLVVAAACGGDDSEPATAAADSDPPPTAEAAPAEPTQDEVDEAAPPGADAGVVEGDLTSTVASGWNVRAVGEGTKPVLALDPEGVPGLAFLQEDIGEGFVAYARASDGWSIDRFVEGYFYGPIGLDYGPDGAPNIAYHDHQADTFQDDLGDLAYARLDADGWQLQAAASDGHDGWDSTIRVGADGVVHAAGVDPSQFGRTEGLEYYQLVDGEWLVEAVGSGPIEYEWNVDLQVDSTGAVGLTYFLTDSSDLVYASRSTDGTWTDETIDSDGDVGRFSSFAYDSDGVAHVAYWSADTGEIRYATNDAGAWSIEPVGQLSGVEIGFEAARRITSLALDGEDNPRVVFSDVSGIWLGSRDAAGAWTTEQLVTAGARPLGQLVSMEVDGAGVPHIAYFEVTGNGPLTGVIAYLTPAV